MIDKEQLPYEVQYPDEDHEPIEVTIRVQLHKTIKIDGELAKRFGKEQLVQDAIRDGRIVLWHRTYGDVRKQLTDLFAYVAMLPEGEAKRELHRSLSAVCNKLQFDQ